MAFEVKMPQLGLTMEEGTVTKWVKQTFWKLQQIN